MIYTTYFAKLKTLPVDVIPVAICSKRPSWFNGLHYPRLKPEYDFFIKYKQTGDMEYFTSCYNSLVLSKLNPHEVVQELYGLTGGKDLALVCYEKPSDFCHRHLVASWLTSNGYNCSEFC